MKHQLRRILCWSLLPVFVICLALPGCGGDSGSSTAETETPPPTPENDEGQAEAAGMK